MKIRRLDHISIAVRDLEASRHAFAQILNVSAGEIEELPAHGVRYAFLDLPNVRIELISPIDESANLNKFLEKRGEGLHHVSIAVDGLHQTLNKLAADGVRLIDSEPRDGAEGKRVAFIHPESTGGVLIELEEE